MGIKWSYGNVFQKESGLLHDAVPHLNLSIINKEKYNIVRAYTFVYWSNSNRINEGPKMIQGCYEKPCHVWRFDNSYDDDAVTPYHIIFELSHATMTGSDQPVEHWFQ